MNIRQDLFSAAKIDGVDTALGMKIESHPDFTHNVIIVIGEQRITVQIDELERALANIRYATHTSTCFCVKGERE